MKILSIIYIQDLEILNNEVLILRNENSKH